MGALIDGLAAQQPPPQGCASCHGPSDFLRGCVIQTDDDDGDFGDLPGDPPASPPAVPLVGSSGDPFPCDIPSIPVVDFLHIASDDVLNSSNRDPGGGLPVHRHQREAQLSILRGPRIRCPRGAGLGEVGGAAAGAFMPNSVATSARVDVAAAKPSARR